jgi:hypothetical protein
MTRTLEVEIDASGFIHAVGSDAKLPQGRATLSWESDADYESFQLSETALAEDWLRPEEDEAWLHLQPGK